MSFCHAAEGDANEHAVVYYARLLVFAENAVTCARVALFMLGRGDMARARVMPLGVMPARLDVLELSGSEVPYDCQRRD